jgi:hypothetical protein
VLALLLVIRPVEKHHVKMWIQSQITRRTLHHDHRARFATSRSNRTRVPRLHARHEDPRQRRQKTAIHRQSLAPRKRERGREHPLPKRYFGQDLFDQMSRGGAHPPTGARGAKSTAFAAKRHKPTLLALGTPKPRTTQKAAIEIRFELLLGVLAQFDVERTVGDGAVERLEVVSHDVVERCALRSTALVRARVGRKGLNHSPRLREPRADADARAFEGLAPSTSGGRHPRRGGRWERCLDRQRERGPRRALEGSARDRRRPGGRVKSDHGL